MREAENNTTLTGRFRWETAYCTRCKDRTTHWFLNDDRSKCSVCDLEKTRSNGVGLGLNQDRQESDESAGSGLNLREQIHRKDED